MYFPQTALVAFVLSLFAALPVRAVEEQGAPEGEKHVDLEVGDAAPEFSAKTDEDKDWQSEEVKGKKILIVYFYPHRWVNEAGSESEAEIKAVAKRRVGAQLDQLDAELARHGGPWFLGEAYSLLDAYIFTLCRWTRHFSPDSPVRPARERPHLGPYLQRVFDRPALRRVMTNEGLAEPWV